MPDFSPSAASISSGFMVKSSRRRKAAGSAISTENELDRIYRLVAAMKGAGIYTAISPFWGSHARLRKSWGVADPGGETVRDCSSSIRSCSAATKPGSSAIYADVNPYTGMPLAKDPAVAMIQIQNEDSLLFYTSQSIKGQALKNLCKLYGALAPEEVRLDGEGPRQHGKDAHTRMTISPPERRGCSSCGS